MRSCLRDAAVSERSEILDMLTTLQLSGMRATYDEIVTMSVKRQHGVERVIHALLKAEIATKQARSINYQLGVAKLPLAKELAELSFEGTPINGELIAQLATGAFLDDKRNVVLVGGTGTGKSHIAIGIARIVIRAGYLSLHLGTTPGTLAAHTAVRAWLQSSFPPA